MTSPINVYAQAIASGLGHEVALEKVYEAGEYHGHLRANDALNWSTSCLGCASRLDRTYDAQMSGEAAGYRNSLDILSAVERQVSKDETEARHVLAILRYRLKNVLAGYER